MFTTQLSKFPNALFEGAFHTWATTCPVEGGSRDPVCNSAFHGCACVAQVWVICFCNRGTRAGSAPKTSSISNFPGVQRNHKTFSSAMRNAAIKCSVCQLQIARCWSCAPALPHRVFPVKLPSPLARDHLEWCEVLTRLPRTRVDLSVVCA